MLNRFRIDFQQQLIEFGIHTHALLFNFLKRFWRMHQIRKYVNQHNFDFLVDHRPKDEYFKELLYAKYAYQHLKNRIYVVHSARKETYLY